VVIDLLLAIAPQADEIESVILRHAPALAVPHLLDVEVTQALRRLAASGAVSASDARTALSDLRDLPLQRYPHLALIPRAFELRANVTAYDGVYLALAEGLGADLYTRDRRLARAPGHRAKVRLIG
jgi:predicted nucleic acid-binding protein